MLWGQAAGTQQGGKNLAMVGRHVEYVAGVDLEQQVAAFRMVQVIEGVQGAHQAVQVDEFLIIVGQHENTVRVEWCAVAEADGLQVRSMAVDPARGGIDDGQELRTQLQVGEMGQHPALRRAEGGRSGGFGGAAGVEVMHEIGERHGENPSWGTE